MLPQLSEQSLRDDIRFLGSILGDTIREQEGQDVYAKAGSTILGTLYKLMKYENTGTSTPTTVVWIYKN